MRADEDGSQRRTNMLLGEQTSVEVVRVYDTLGESHFEMREESEDVYKAHTSSHLHAFRLDDGVAQELKSGRSSGPKKTIRTRDSGCNF